MGAVIFIIAGLLFVAYGGNYFYVAGTTNSAIHELNGIAGIGLGLLMFGHAWVLGTLGGIRDRVRNIEDTADDARADAIARDVIEAHRNPLLVLVAISRAAGDVTKRHREEMISYLREVMQTNSFGNSERRALGNLLIALPATEEALRNALTEVRDYSNEEMMPLRRAADAIIKTSKARSDRQSRLYTAAFPS